MRIDKTRDAISAQAFAAFLDLHFSTPTLDDGDGDHAVADLLGLEDGCRIELLGLVIVHDRRGRASQLAAAEFLASEGGELREEFGFGDQLRADDAEGFHKDARAVLVRARGLRRRDGARL